MNFAREMALMQWDSDKYWNWTEHRERLETIRQMLDREKAERVAANARRRVLWKRLWRAWSRCEVPTDRDYPRYGGRGIRFGFPSVEAALKYVVETLGWPGIGQSLDRIDNERGYEPGNLRWATHSQQMSNRRCSAKYRFLALKENPGG